MEAVITPDLPGAGTPGRRGLSISLQLRRGGRSWLTGDADELLVLVQLLQPRVVPGIVVIDGIRDRDGPHEGGASCVLLTQLPVADLLRPAAHLEACRKHGVALGHSGGEAVFEQFAGHHEGCSRVMVSCCRQVCQGGIGRQAAKECPVGGLTAAERAVTDRSRAGLRPGARRNSPPACGCAHRAAGPWCPWRARGCPGGRSHKR